MLILFLFVACEPSTKDSGTIGNQEQSAIEDCPSSWEQNGEVWIDPVACKVWSPMYEDITWFEAISSEEATTGGCDQICDNDESINTCSDLELEGITNWRVPTIEELEDIVMRTPPFATEGYLWSNTSDTMDDMAWSVDLSSAGMSVAAFKSNPQGVRCIAD